MDALKNMLDIGGSNSFEGHQSVLLIEIADQFTAFAVLNSPDKTLIRYCCYSAEEGEEALFPLVFSRHPELHQPFSQVAIAYYFDEAVMVPARVHHSDMDNLYLKMTIAPKTDAVVHSDFLADLGIYCLYYVPVSINNIVSRTFLTGKYWHMGSLHLKNRETGYPFTMLVDFKANTFSVILLKDGQLQLCQLYHYSTPEDILYILLKICRQFTISQNDLKITLSGFLEKDSMLYREIFKYFRHIEFADTIAMLKCADDFSSLPGYYFDSMAKLAACV